METFKPGNRVRVKVKGAPEWISGVVMVASKNALSLRCQRTLGVGSFAIMRDRGGFYVATLLIYNDKGKWIDIASQKELDLEKIPAARGTAA